MEPIEYAQWLHPNETEKEITQPSVDELRKFLSPGDVAIDIGAHTGDSTIPIALAVGKPGCVLALEPNRYVFPVLKKNSELNTEKTNIIPLMFAATPEDAEMEFQYSDSGYCNGGRFRGNEQMDPRARFQAKSAGKKSAFVPQEGTIRSFCPEFDTSKWTRKDMNPSVLRSLWPSLISEYKPFLKVEVYRKLDDAQRRALYRSISAHRYVIHKIADDGNYFGETLTEQDMSKWRHFDIFCVPDVASAGCPPWRIKSSPVLIPRAVCTARPGPEGVSIARNPRWAPESARELRGWGRIAPRSG